MRKKCCMCGKLSQKWERVNGVTYCYDGCHSTTGKDRRTTDGLPAWEKVGGLLPFAPSRMKK